MEESEEMSEPLVLKPREHDLGDLTVRRLLPVAQRRMVGPFIFFDHMGPAQFQPGRAVDVRPHPHIGLATITYLFEGQILHRDSLGSDQTIDPGDLNLMIAGSGIAHSERVTDKVRHDGQKLHGLQLWIALPVAHEECPAEFFHHPGADLPKGSGPGSSWTLIMGSAFGQTSPAKIYSPMTYLEITLEAGACLALPEGIPEKAVYLVSGDIEIECQPIAPGEMAVWAEGEALTVMAREDSHLVMIGGAPFPEPRFIYWNFVSSDKERLEQAKADWKGGRFPKVPGDEIEFIPLPD